MKLGVIKVVLVFILPCSPSFMYAQSSQADMTSFWVNSGLGYSNLGLSLGCSLNFPLDETSLISVRYSNNQEFKLLSQNEIAWDIGAMYGFKTNSELFHASISSGISVVGGTKFGNVIPGEHWFTAHRQEIKFSAIGIPVDVQLFLMLSNVFGIGLCGNANINGERSFSSILFCVQLGHFN